MNDDEFARHLAWAYRGEVSGEVLFSELAELFGEHRASLELLSLLEQRMQTVLEPILRRYQVDPGDLDRARRSSHDNAVTSAQGGWESFLGLFEPVTTEAIERYRLLGQVIPSDGPVGLAELLVEHEQALGSFAQAEMTAPGSDTTAEVTRVLGSITAWDAARR